MILHYFNFPPPIHVPQFTPLLVHHPNQFFLECVLCGVSHGF